MLKKLQENAQETITAFAASPTSGTLVTCSRNLLMRVWDVGTGECKRSWKAHRLPILCASFEPSGTLVATGGSDRTVFVWDVDGGYATHSFKGHDALVTVVAFLPHPHSVQRLASGAENGSVRIWDLLTQSCVAVLSEHYSSVTSIGFSPDPHGYTMLTAGRDSMINLWDTRDFDAQPAATSSGGVPAKKAEVRAQVTTHEAVESLVVLPASAGAPTASNSGGSSSSASSASASGSDFFWFTAGEKGVLRKWRLQVLPGKDGKPGSRRYIAGAVAARTVPQLRAASSTTVASSVTQGDAAFVPLGDTHVDTPQLTADVCSKALAVSADAVPVTGQFSALLLRRTPAVGGSAASASAPAAPVEAAIDSSSSGDKAASKRKRPADVLTDSTAAAAASASSSFEVVAVTRDQVLTLLTAGALGHVKTIVANSDEVVDLHYLPPPLPVPSDAPVPGLALHPIHSKQLVAVATNSEQLRLMDVSDFSSTLCEGHGGIVLSASPSPDGTLVATASKDGTARVWDVATGACIAVCEGHTEAVTGVAWPVKPSAFLHAVPQPLLQGAAQVAAVLGSSSWVATVSKDRTLKVWQLSTLLAQLPSPRPAGWSRAHLRAILAPGAQAPASGSFPFDPLPALRPRTLAAAVAHEKDINAIAVAPNDRLIATASQDKSVKLWTSPDLHPVATLSGHKRGVWGVAFSPTDQLLASASGDRTVRLWSVGRASGYACVRTLEGHDASVLSVRFLPSGTQLVSSGADGLLKLWSTSDGEAVNTFDGHEDKVWALAVRPPGSVAEPKASATAGMDVDEDGSPGASASSSPSQHPLGEILTGGGDAVIAVWRDVTSSEAAHDIAATEEAVAKQQSLFTAMALRDYPGAIGLALELEQPGRAGDIMQELLEQGPRPATAGLSSSALDDKFRREMLDEVDEMAAEEDGRVLASAMASPGVGDGAANNSAGEAALIAILRSRLPPHLLGRLLSYIREWNTQSRHGMLAQRLLHLLLRALPRSKLLAGLAALRDEEGATRMVPGIGAVRVRPPTSAAATSSSGDASKASASSSSSSSSSAAQAELRALIAALLPYSERHGERLDRLQLSAYLADYTLDSMTVVSPEAAGLTPEEAQAMTAGLERPPQPKGGVSAVLVQPGDGSDSDDDSDDDEGADRSALPGGGWGSFAAKAKGGAPRARSGSSASGSAAADSRADQVVASSRKGAKGKAASKRA